MRNVYYAPLVRWEIVEEIIFLVETEDREEVQKLVIGSIDHIVMETILLHLDKEDHAEFLRRSHETYHDPSLLDWVKSRAYGVEDAIIRAIRETKASIRTLLE
ncbi:MAG: hypothetical protein GW941_01820 [Candidatus Pacebacteria bacterium]|nr:hypothetical protein [Candidatus Paceibacterota bacterium]